MTTANWTFRYGTKYTIDSSVKKEGAASIKFYDSGDANRESCCCTYTGTTALAQGEIQTWMYWAKADGVNQSGIIYCCASNTNPLGSSSSYYGLEVNPNAAGTSTVWSLSYNAGGSATGLGSGTVALTELTWYQIKFAWWNSGADKAFRCQYRTASGGAWTNLFADSTHAGGLGNSGYVGVGKSNQANDPVWFDTTVVYGKIT